MESSVTLFRQIGKGHCGSVWAVDRSGSSCALKRGDGAPGRSLENDYEMHQRLLASLERLQLDTDRFSQIHIPKCRALIAAEDRSWWDKRMSRFPKGYEPCQVLISERIPPFSQTVREALIDRFCVPRGRKLIKETRADEDCIVRAYLGRRRINRRRSTHFFSLRNFPLNLDQMEELEDLDILGYARTMADALAMMHWDAQIDANDVEFVLASSRLSSPSTSVSPSSAATKNSPRLVTTFPSNELGEHSMWILDFDCCNAMSMDESGVDQAVGAFFRNDPYYPRPRYGNVDDQDLFLWTNFRERYLQTSRSILGEDSPSIHLPLLLMEEIEREAIGIETRRKADEDIVF